MYARFFLQPRAAYVISHIYIYPHFNFKLHMLDNKPPNIYIYILYNTQVIVVWPSATYKSWRPKINVFFVGRSVLTLSGSARRVGFVVFVDWYVTARSAQPAAARLCALKNHSQLMLKPYNMRQRYAMRCEVFVFIPEQFWLDGSDMPIYFKWCAQCF